MSKHSRFRLNIQYLFLLLNDSNMRQLKAGIYKKYNKSKTTASSYLNLLSKEELENDMGTVFSGLRNTKQFWRIPRNNLYCIVEYYNAPTWFLTLSPAEWLWPDFLPHLRDVNKPRFDKLPASQLIL